MDGIGVVVVVLIPYAPARALVEQGVAVAFAAELGVVTVFRATGGFVVVTILLIVGNIRLIADDNLQLSEVALDVVVISVVVVLVLRGHESRRVLDTGPLTNLDKAENIVVQIAVGEVGIVDHRCTWCSKNNSVCFLDVLNTGDVVDLVVVDESNAQAVVNGIITSAASDNRGTVVVCWRYL